jgi:hypothetical protein
MKMAGGNLEIFNEKQNPNKQVKNKWYFSWIEARLRFCFAELRRGERG